MKTRAGTVLPTENEMKRQKTGSSRQSENEIDFGKH